MATAQEIGGRGLEAVAGRERWSALDKPPLAFSLPAPLPASSPSAPLQCVWMYVCLPLIGKSADGDTATVICTLPALRQGRGPPLYLDGVVASPCVAKQLSNLEAGL